MVVMQMFTVYPFYFPESLKNFIKREKTQRIITAATGQM